LNKVKASQIWEAFFSSGKLPLKAGFVKISFLSILTARKRGFKINIKGSL